MSTAFPTTANNPHIAALEHVFAKSNDTIEWLVITHNDSKMLRSLHFALGDESAAVLEVSQDTWDFEGKQLAETIEWALQQSEIKNLVLVGNSDAKGPESRASLVASKSNAALEDGYGKLLAGVQSKNARRLEAQERLAANVQQASQIPVVHNRWSNGELAVHGLFYRAETGFFMAYNTETDSFQPAPARLVAQE